MLGRQFSSQTVESVFEQRVHNRLLHRRTEDVGSHSGSMRQQDGSHAGCHRALYVKKVTFETISRSERDNGSALIPGSAKLWERPCLPSTVSF